MFRYFFWICLCVWSILFTDETEMRTKISDAFQSSKTPYVVRLVINDASLGISSATLVYVRSAIEYCRVRKPSLVILELNTPGGEVYASQQIGNALRALDTRDGIPVMAYINNWAISAGAMLAYSCRYIVASPDACMGAACPVFFTKDEMKEAPEKVNSALRSDFANRAAFFDRNPDIALAMVDADTLLVRRGDEIKALMLQDDLDPTDIILSPKGKLLTLTSRQLKSFGVADYCVDKRHAGVPDELLPHITPISQTVFAQFPGFEGHQSVKVETYEMPLKSKFFAMLASSTVSSALFFIVCICVYMEMSSPGILVPALIGGICLALIILGSFAQQAIDWFEPACVLIGAALIAVECIVFPTCGFLLILGGLFVVCAIASVLLPGLKEVSIQGFDLNAAGEYVSRRLAAFCMAFGVSLLFVIPIMRLFMKKVGLPTMPSEGNTTGSSPLIGKRGIVVAALRPAGKMVIDEQLYDVISEGQFIEEGVVVQVVSHNDARIIVKSD